MGATSPNADMRPAMIKRKKTKEFLDRALQEESAAEKTCPTLSCMKRSRARMRRMRNDHTAMITRKEAKEFLDRALQTYRGGDAPSAQFPGSRKPHIGCLLGHRPGHIVYRCMEESGSPGPQMENGNTLNPTRATGLDSADVWTLAQFPTGKEYSLHYNKEPSAINPS